MNDNLTLVIMAAGMGSRYGGLKQIDPVGPNGEIIIDYSIFDAISAGFNKIIFIITKELEAPFKEIIGNRISQYVDVEYAYQQLDDLPKPFKLPEGRTKPWGTSHAILAAKQLVNEPFAVINADDYYGRETFLKVADYLREDSGKSADKYNFCMAGFRLLNTVSESGYVARGVCTVSDNGHLLDIIERTQIKTENGEISFSEDGGELWENLEPNSSVSMNFWGFTPHIFKELEFRFPEFLKKHGNELKSEYYLPTAVGELLAENKAQVKVLETSEKWYGVTYKEDKEEVVAAIKKLTDDGKYPNPLWQ